MLELLLDDIFKEFQTPEIQGNLEKYILRPLVSRLLNIVYPYLFGILFLWIIMFSCLVIILFILIRGSISDIIWISKQ
jgi:hypothetical protein